MRKWVVNNIDKEPASFLDILRYIYSDSKSVMHKY